MPKARFYLLKGDNTCNPHEHEIIVPAMENGLGCWVLGTVLHLHYIMFYRVMQHAISHQSRHTVASCICVDIPRQNTGCGASG